MNKDDFLWVMNGKGHIFLLLILRTREGLMSFITNLIEPFRGDFAQVHLSEVAKDRDRQKFVMSNLAC